MDKLPPYPLRPQFPFEKDITDQIRSRLPAHVLSDVQCIQHQLESHRQHVLMSARSMGKSISPSDVCPTQLHHGFYDTEGHYNVGVLIKPREVDFKQALVDRLNDENTESRIKEFMALTVNVPKGDW